MASSFTLFLILCHTAQSAQFRNHAIFIPRLPGLSTVYRKKDQKRKVLLTMTAKLVSVLSLIMMNMFVALCCAVTMYVAVMAACERRVFPLQGLEMEGGPQIADHGAADWRRVVRRNRQTFNDRIGNRARLPQEHDERVC